jgi:glycosyltransferase involved in cell wall biosynthesis
MKILYICNKSPYPPNEGGSLGMYVFIKGMIEAGHQVKVLAFNTNKSYIDPKDIPEDFKKQTAIEFVDLDLSVKPLAAFLNLFSGKSFHVERFNSIHFKNKLVETLHADSYDIVQVEYLPMAVYREVIRKHSNARIVLRSHNVEHLIWERITSNTKNPLKKLYLASLTRKLKNFELSSLNLFDGVTTVSHVDAHFFNQLGYSVPILNVPFGVDVRKYECKDSEIEFPSLFHLGAMNWIPNEEGIKWFLDNCWVKIHQKFPALKFYLAGRMMPEWLIKLNLPNVVVVGEVPDAREFMRSKAVMIVPLLSGSGIRVKIIEGMALVKAVISTNIGAEGIEFQPGEHLLIANTPEEFVTAIEQCIADRDFCNLLGKNARKLIEERYDMPQIINRLVDFYRQLMEN